MRLVRLGNFDGVEIATLLTCPAFDAELDVYPVRFLFLPRDGFRRTYPLASQTPRAEQRVDAVRNQVAANAGGAPSLIDMRLVLMAEVAKGGEHRVGSGSAEGAQ